ncbi:MAG: hypothetical protein R2710_30505 [Acidimicrobiales bacterium]
MLDHVFTDAIGALRDALEAARLERQALEERFQTDVLRGDVTWETTYALPGEGSPPRIQADLTLEWPTWSQTAYRTWYLDEEFTEGPIIDIEIVFRIQQLEAPASPQAVMAVVPLVGPTLGDDLLEASGPTLETVYATDLEVASHSIEVSYQGSLELDEATLEDGSSLDTKLAAIGGWVASTLTRLGDLSLAFRPPEPS